MISFAKIKESLKARQADAWIVVDYENRNPSVVAFLGRLMLTRKIFLVVPLKGKPYLICHAIDTVFLNKKEITDRFDLRVYKDWREMLSLEEAFKSYKRVMMDVSDKGLLPRVSLADYGSVEYIRSLGCEIVSSADLLQRINAVYGARSHELQIKADEIALRIKDDAFKEIARRVEKDGGTDEFSIQRFISEAYHAAGMVYDEPPIVAINRNASNPHYAPTEKIHSPIGKGDLVLIDMWAKLDDPEAVYSDITWMGYVGDKIPQKMSDRFAILRDAIDKALAFLKKELPLRRVEGWEVDRLVRDEIGKTPYGRYFIHRTGHNIAVDVSPHGPGVNMDDYESHDGREIVDGISFSLEPGIYAPDFGVRSETNVYIDDRRPVVVAGRQREIVPILAK
ncbi:MAG: aminopeptidase P family protein [Bacilli bacterium]|jgi:Xaa-Pro aminopeptidase|nr:aminopeptidase P family protein [Bacilli bacterium]